MSARRSLVVLAVLTAVAVVRPVLADVPPSPDSPDAHCSAAEQCPTGTFCDYAFRPGQPPGDAEEVGKACRAEVAARGLQRRCRDGGNYGGRELFCTPGEAGSWAPPGSKDRGVASAPPLVAKTEPVAKDMPAATPAAGKKSGCAVDGGAMGLGWLFAALALRRRKRRTIGVIAPWRCAGRSRWYKVRR